jgi:hypothetical protein
LARRRDGGSREDDYHNIARFVIKSFAKTRRERCGVDAVLYDDLDMGTNTAGAMTRHGPLRTAQKRAENSVITITSSPVPLGGKRQPTSRCRCRDACEKAGSRPEHCAPRCADTPPTVHRAGPPAVRRRQLAPGRLLAASHARSVAPRRGGARPRFLGPRPGAHAGFGRAPCDGL